MTDIKTRAQGIDPNVRARDVVAFGDQYPPRPPRFPRPAVCGFGAALSPAVHHSRRSADGPRAMAALRSAVHRHSRAVDTRQGNHRLGYAVGRRLVC